VSRLLAAIDLGTNTVRILVAEADRTTGLVPLWAEQSVTRLGEGLARRGTLAPEAVERTLAAVRRYRDRALALGAAEVMLVATAAARQAHDGSAFLARLQAEPGLRPRIVSGEAEAELTLMGAAWGLGAPGDAFALLDIGGGSTEIVIAEGARALAAVSLRLGVVQLVERFFPSDPVQPSELTACRAYVDGRFREEAWPRLGAPRPARLVATAGTPATLAVLDLGLRSYEPARVHGHQLTAEAITRLTAELASMPVAERARTPGLEPGRADVIVPGAIVLAAALAGLGLSVATVSDAGLREGILLAAVGWHSRDARRND
jgi:exopolyphosphatase / guanosine-5'-triphosphate,3'-diphosphate pyrophosphatase